MNNLNFSSFACLEYIINLSQIILSLFIQYIISPLNRRKSDLTSESLLTNNNAEGNNNTSHSSSSLTMNKNPYSLSIECEGVIAWDEGYSSPTLQFGNNNTAVGVRPGALNNVSNFESVPLMSTPPSTDGIIHSVAVSGILKPVTTFTVIISESRLSTKCVTIGLAHKSFLLGSGVSNGFGLHALSW